MRPSRCCSRVLHPSPSSYRDPRCIHGRTVIATGRRFRRDHEVADNAEMCSSREARRTGTASIFLSLSLFLCPFAEVAPGDSSGRQMTLDRLRE